MPATAFAPSLPFRAPALAVLLAGSLLLSVPSAAARGPDGGGDRTLAPYFAIPGGAPGIEGLPLESTRADVHISGVIAHVAVKQRYRNRGKTAIEAIYVFPGSTRAAVYAMSMKVGDRLIKAEIQERDAARKLYEAAKAAGKTASLLEQERPNVFQMNVANIQPGDIVDVELDYAELLIPTSGQYELVIPAVVGPRYTNTPAAEASSHDQFTASPFLHAGDAVPFDWDVSVKIQAGVGIQSLASPSHTIDKLVNGAEASVRLGDGARTGDKDFVLHYSLRGSAVSSGLVLFPGHEPKDEKFFLVNVQPPAALEDAAIPDREYVFIVDVSGSMHGFPIDTAKVLMNDLLSGLKPTDKYNILTFSGGSQTLAPESIRATPENIAKGLRFISGYAGGGGTEIVPALKHALGMQADESLSRVFVAVTDGYVSVEAECFDLIRKNLGKANLFAFGIGSSINRFLIEGMARAGLGEPFFVMNATDANTEVAKLQAMIASPALTRVKVGFAGFDAYDVEPSAIPDLFAEKPVVLFGKYRGEARGTITVSGFTGKGRFEQKIDVSRVSPDEDNEALPILWARHRIGRLSDDEKLHNNTENKQAVTDLGLKYGLMTAYTSFLAVDHRVRGDGTSEKVKQPLPMPAGVEDSAVGEEQGALGYRGAGIGGGGVALGRVSSLSQNQPVTPSAPPPAVMRPSPVRRMPSKPSGASVSKDEENEGRSQRAELVVSIGAVQGSLTAAQARGLVAAMRAVLACAGENGSGELVLEIDATGAVVGVTPQATKGLNLGASCVTQGLRALKFPASSGTTRITVKVLRI